MVVTLPGIPVVSLIAGVWWIAGGLAESQMERDDCQPSFFVFIFGEPSFDAFAFRARRSGAALGAGTGRGDGRPVHQLLNRLIRLPGERR